ncbi:MAG: flagellar biosynthetic protein FliR [Candidatus Sericytochromatia bacterium]|nr:flagellar biosynthetic protein FliR [Candidatus Tanganyikabacteria bacterium]
MQPIPTLDLGGLLALPQQTVLVFMLLLCRFSAMMVTAPIYSNVQVPVRIRVGLGFFLALMLLPVQLGRAPVPQVGDPGALTMALAGELVAGLLLGFVTMLLIHAIQFAGYMIGLQMGFGMDQIFDPNSGGQITSLALILTAVATISFLLIDGHHFLVLAVAKSLEVMPPGEFYMAPQVKDHLMDSYNGMLTIVFTLLLPILGVLLLAELALAIMNRVMPQMNVFVAGFPIKIGVGILTIFLGLPLMMAYFDDLFLRWIRQALAFFV